MTKGWMRLWGDAAADPAAATDECLLRARLAALIAAHRVLAGGVAALLLVRSALLRQDVDQWVDFGVVWILAGIVYAVQFTSGRGWSRAAVWACAGGLAGIATRAFERHRAAGGVSWGAVLLGIAVLPMVSVLFVGGRPLGDERTDQVRHRATYTAFGVLWWGLALSLAVRTYLSEHTMCWDMVLLWSASGVLAALALARRGAWSGLRARRVGSVSGLAALLVAILGLVLRRPWPDWGLLAGCLAAGAATIWAGSAQVPCPPAD